MELDFIEQNDCQLITEYCLLNIAYKYQFEIGKLSSMLNMIVYNMYLSPHKYQFIQMDISLLQVMVLILDSPDYVVKQLSDYFNIKDASNTDEIKSFISICIQIIRSFIGVSTLSEVSLMKLYMI